MSVKSSNTAGDQVADRGGQLAVGGRELLENAEVLVAGERQVAHREIGLAQNLGGSGATCVVTILGAA